MEEQRSRQTQQHLKLLRAEASLAMREAALQGGQLKTADQQQLGYRIADQQQMGYRIADQQHLVYSIADQQQLDYRPAAVLRRLKIGSFR